MPSLSNIFADDSAATPGGDANPHVADSSATVDLDGNSVEDGDSNDSVLGLLADDDDGASPGGDGVTGGPDFSQPSPQAGGPEFSEPAPQSDGFDTIDG